jgi:hypothetical protein
MQPDYQAMPLKEIFVLKEANALRITAIKENVHGMYEEASLLDVQELSPAEEMRYQHRMNVCRQIRAIVEDDFGMLYASLYTQDDKFELIEDLLKSISNTN